ncbi:MAG: RNA polymerase factor sigma-54 [Gemmataceae bacterium]
MAGMSFQMGMTTKMSQSMVLAPRMIHSMEILQLPIMDLQQKISDELLENPFLEVQEGAKDTPDADAADTTDTFEASEPQDPTDPNSELVIDVNSDGAEDFDRLTSINDDWSDHFNEEHRVSSNRIQEEADKKHLAETNMVARSPSLAEHLEDQLGFLDADEEQLSLARYILAHLDAKGYLETTLENITVSYERLVEIEDVEEALHLVQMLEPAGVGARDLRECLLLQVTHETPHADVVRVIIQHHLEDVRFNRLPNVQKKTNFPMETIQEAVEVLRHLNPRPGSQFSDESTQYVVPDVIVDRTEDGDYEVRLVDDWTPSLYISKRYRELIRSKVSDEKAKNFVKEKIQSAKWLIEAIEQRRSTLLQVTKAIIEHQKAFLEHGIDHIRPLKMQQIADLVEVHVTTVSRAVDKKWVQTPRGIFSLRRFFGGGKEANGEEVAYEAIKKKLVELVENEDKTAPLSDDALVKQLEAAGYPVARRTVTKYRDALNIPSSRQRKVWS